MVSLDFSAVVLTLSPFPYTISLLIAAVVIWATWRWWVNSSQLTTGEPPLVPYWVPWLGHGFSFLTDLNGLTAWIRSLFPRSPAVTVQLGGRHLYVIFDPKLAGQIYRKSKVFVFNPFNILVWEGVGATKEDVQIAKIGAPDLQNDPGIKDDGRHVLHDLHVVANVHLMGDGLKEATDRFIKTLCDDLEKRFPLHGSNEWETLDLCDFVKRIWTHASITALFGTHIYEVWPDVDTWVWDFDRQAQKFMTKLPRFLIPQAYAVRDEGLKRFELWEADALRAQAEGRIGGDPAWDPYWGHRHVRLRAKTLADSGISARGRAGVEIAFLWGLNSNAIPVAMQVMVQAVINPKLLAELRQEISKCQTGLASFNMTEVTTQRKLKSIYLEALRWATASPTPRVVREDCELGGYQLKSNSMLIVDSRHLQIDSATWEIPGIPESDPALFWPERFLDGDDKLEAERVSELAEAEANYIADTTKPTKRTVVEPISGPKSKDTQQRLLSLRPFGGGITLCPGRHFATNEILGGLAALMLRLEIEPIEEDLRRIGIPQPNLMKQGGLLPDRPLMVRIRRRH